MLQGSSYVTPTKEIQIYNIVKMRLLQRKNQYWINNIVIFDIFSGNGENIVDNSTIDGSPIEIAKAVKDSNVNAIIYASDINYLACEHLEKNLGKYPNVYVENSSAQEMLITVSEWLEENKSNHAIVLVDPNGPAAFPWKEILFISKNFKKQVDLIMNISETAINRILGCGITKNKNWWKKYNSFVGVLWSVAKFYKAGWIRTPINKDSQKWRLFCLWSFVPPRSNWKDQNMYRFTSRNELKKIIER